MVSKQNQDLRPGVSGFPLKLPSSATTRTAEVAATSARSSIATAASAHSTSATATAPASPLIVGKVPRPSLLVDPVVPLLAGSFLGPAGVHHPLALEALVVALVLFVYKITNMNKAKHVDMTQSFIPTKIKSWVNFEKCFLLCDMKIPQGGRALS